MFIRFKLHNVTSQFNVFDNLGLFFSNTFDADTEMFYLIQTIQNLSLINFISLMFIEFAQNEMDERDCYPYFHQTQNCPLRKLVHPT